MVNTPLLSVIIPVHDAELYISQCLDSVLSQSVSLEVICVDDGSVDKSCEIIDRYCKAYSNICLIKQPNLGAGIARNNGLSYAKGKYVHFLDSDDWIAEDTYSLIIDRMENSNVEVCIFQKYIYDNKTKLSFPVIKAFQTNQYITNIDSNPVFLLKHPVVPWNKIIKRSLIDDLGLKYDGTVCANDRTFYFALITHAPSVMICKEPLIYYRVNNSKSLVGTTRSKHYDAHFSVFKSTMSAVEDKNSIIQKIIWDAAFIDMFIFYNKAHIFYKPRIYKQLHRFFNSLENTDYCTEDCSWFSNYEYIRNHRYGFLKFYVSNKLKSKEKTTIDKKQQESSKDLIVSLTSFPERISTIHYTIKSILDQSIKPEHVILWLANEQFPNLESDLPPSLKELKKHGLVIRFCEDLKPHKKYYYAMQEYPNKIIVTVDDDVIYDSDVIEVLLESYKRHPKAISAMRVHRITVKNEKIEPYSEWAYNDPSLVDIPSIFGLATGVGGVLYPPNILPGEVFDKDAILSTCLYGDDLWLKAHELRAGVPTVAADYSRDLRYVDGTQTNALWIDNSVGGRNDFQLSCISEYFEKNQWKTPKELLTRYVSSVDVTAIVFLGDTIDGAIPFLNNQPENWEFIIQGNESQICEVKKVIGLKRNVKYLVMEPLSKIPIHVVCDIAESENIVFINPEVRRYYSKYYLQLSSSGESLYKTMVSRSLIKDLHFNSLDDDLSLFLYNSDEAKQKLLNGTFTLNSFLHNTIELKRVISIFGIDNPRVFEKWGFYNSDLDSFDECSLFDSSPMMSNEKICPICSHHSKYFKTGGSNLRDNVECPVCKSWERHRLAWSYIQKSITVTEMITVNFPSSCIQYLRSLNVTNTSLEKIPSDYVNPVLLTHALKKREDYDKFLSFCTTCKTKKIFVTFALKKSSHSWSISPIGVMLGDLIKDMEQSGWSVSFVSPRDYLGEQLVNTYAILPHERLIRMEKID